MLSVCLALVLATALAGWFRPRATLLGVLATFALGPEWLAYGHLPHATTELFGPVQKALLLLALVLAGTGRTWRLDLSLPVLAAVGLIAVFGLTAASRPEGLTDVRVLLASVGLAMPFLAAAAPVDGADARHEIGLLLALLPLGCLVVGGALDLLGLHPLFISGGRIQGATNAGWLGFLAYAGFALALHEAARRRQVVFAALVLVNLGIAVLTGGRMAVFACLVQLLAYGALSPALAGRLGHLRWLALLPAALVVIGVVFNVPIVQERMLDDDGDGLNLSGRGDNWADAIQVFLAHPTFGQGMGASEIVRNYFQLPHNEYLRLLADTGATGALVFAAAVLVWARGLLRHTGDDDHVFLHAAFMSAAVFALTDNVLLMPPGMVLFAWFGVLASRPAARA